MKFKGKLLTVEQKICIKCIISCKNVKINAPAGSGKTFICEAAAAKKRGENGLYVCFNKAIADEATSKFPKQVDCRTGHSLAYRDVMMDRKCNYGERFGKITGTLLARNTNIGDHRPFPTPASKGYLIMNTINRFCYSDNKEIKTEHVYIQGPYSPEIIPELEEDIAYRAQEIWKDISDPRNGTLPVTYDAYLKIWALRKPRIYKDFILFDEAQDANPVILDVIKNQKYSQKIYVGDKFQQIYAWRGAINAMESIATEHDVYMTQSFRFGESIAEMANDILRSYMPPSIRPPKIIGFKERESIVTLDSIDYMDVIICRTNGGVMNNVFNLLEKEIPIYIQGGVNQMISLLKGAKDLMDGKRSYCPDLSLFETWEEVIEFSENESGGELKTIVSLIKNYGIPKLMDALHSTCRNAGEAEITITTTHKAKGLEWNNVKLHSDFHTPAEGKQLPQGEINTLYVAATRALSVLDISSCTACHPETLKQAARGGFEY